MVNEKAEGLKEIEALIMQDKLVEAYEVCNKLLLNYPESVRIGRAQGKIEKLVFKKNVKVVKGDLAKLDPLWKEGKYDAILKRLAELQKFVPGYLPVEKQIQKVQRLMAKNVSKIQENTLHQYIDAAKKAINDQNYSVAITTCKSILMKIPDNKPAMQMLVQARQQYIDFQIKDNEFLLKGNKFDEIADFIKHLKSIDPKSQKIPALIKKLSKREELAAKFSKMDFTYQSFEELNTLYQKQKYEAVIKGLKEFVKIDKDNFKALELLKKARIKFKRILERDVIGKMKSLQKKYKKMKSKMPKEFIRL